MVLVGNLRSSIRSGPETIQVFYWFLFPLCSKMGFRGAVFGGFPGGPPGRPPGRPTPWPLPRKQRPASYQPPRKLFRRCLDAAVTLQWRSCDVARWALLGQKQATTLLQCRAVCDPGVLTHENPSTNDPAGAPPGTAPPKPTNRQNYINLFCNF